MRNYIKSELYRNIKRPYFINFTLIMSLFSSIVWFFVSSNVPLDSSIAFIMGRGMLNVPVFLIIFFVTMVTSEDFKNGTIKNVVATGLDRDKIVIGKLITTLILAVISATVILFFYFATALLVLPKMPGGNGVYITDFIYSFLGALPIWLGAISLATFLGFALKSDFSNGVAFIFILSILPKIISFVGFIVKSDKIRDFGDTGMMLGKLSELTNAPVAKDLFLETGFLGLIYMLVFTLLTLLVFRKKDL